MNRHANLNIRRKPTNMNELADCVIKLVQQNVVVDQVTLTGFAWALRYSESVSNSHSSPIVGVQNWGGYPYLPRGYPGLQGRIWIRCDESAIGDFRYRGSDLISGTSTHTGTGGGGSYSGPWRNNDSVDFSSVLYSWDYRIYLDDWPGVKSHIEKALMLKTLKGEPVNFYHEFKWELQESVLDYEQ